MRTGLLKHLSATALVAVLALPAVAAQIGMPTLAPPQPGSTTTTTSPPPLDGPLLIPAGPSAQQPAYQQPVPQPAQRYSYTPSPAPRSAAAPPFGQRPASGNTLSPNPTTTSGRRYPSPTAPSASGRLPTPPARFAAPTAAPSAYPYGSTRGVTPPAYSSSQAANAAPVYGRKPSTPTPQNRPTAGLWPFQTGSRPPMPPETRTAGDPRAAGYAPRTGSPAMNGHGRPSAPIQPTPGDWNPFDKIASGLGWLFGKPSPPPPAAPPKRASSSTHAYPQRR